ncbi:uncharacterized protein LOC108458660 [Gossypium arboreum]|uniref:uncharacterized protein LOC108458660 n=1 Tax=Gossypium arboreum TaxID=29729 RepID=UPI0022F1D11E|nr:uncharacterized protein LOC108458660 [Gossypium arboreum]
MEDQYKWLVEKFRALESVDNYCGMDARELSLVPDLDSLAGAAAKWYNQLSRTQVKSWKDLAQAFMKQYGHITDIAPDRITLQNMKKKPSESFRQYAQRWREVATQVQPPLLEKETTMLFINTLKAPFITHIGSFPLRAVACPHTLSGAITNARSEYHAGLRALDEKLVNAIIENVGRKVKLNIAEVRTPLKLVWNEMQKRGLVPQGLGDKIQDTRNYCEFHHEKDHEIQNCIEFRALVQSLMDNKELEFFESVEEEDVCSLGGESSEEGGRASRPVIIISKPRVSEVEVRVTPRVIIQKPTASPYKDSHRVPWNYNCSITVSEKEGSINTSNIEVEPAKGKLVMFKKEAEGSESQVNEPVMETEAKEFLKFLRHSEYSVVEQLHQRPDRISVLALLLNSEVHRKALMKVLNETYVADDISVNKLDRLVGNISADNFISFSDDEIPPGGRGSTKALHVTTRCKGNTLPGVLVDNGSALSVLLGATLNRLHRDASHMKTCQNIVRAFDGTERKVMGRIEVPLQIGPNTYEVDFLVMDIKPSYNCLLGRPWIHSAGAVPSSLHQKLKMVTEGRLITINAEDIIASITSDAPYIENDNEAVECSFRSLEFVNAMFIAEGNRIPIPRISGATKMNLQLTVGKGALPGRGLGKHLRGQVRVPVLVGKWDRFGLGFRPDASQVKKEFERKQEQRRARLSGTEVRWEPMSFPHISQTFVSGGFIHSAHERIKEGRVGDVMGIWSVNATFEEEAIERNLSGICPYEPGSVLNNWTVEEIPILPHKETTEIVALEEGKEVKIGTCVNEKTRQNLIELLQEFKDVFAWSYQDMPGLSTDITVHRVPTKKEYKPVQ